MVSPRRAELLRYAASLVAQIEVLYPTFCNPLTLVPLCLVVAPVVVGVASAASAVGSGFTYGGPLAEWQPRVL